MLGDITVRYPILPFGIAVIRWAAADISRASKTEARSGQIPPAVTLHAPLHRHELFPFFYLVPALFLSPNIHLSSARFLIFLTEAASSRLSHHHIISPSACFNVFVSLFLSCSFWSALLTYKKAAGWIEMCNTHNASTVCNWKKCVALCQYFKVLDWNPNL